MRKIVSRKERAARWSGGVGRGGGGWRAEEGVALGHTGAKLMRQPVNHEENSRAPRGREREREGERLTVGPKYSWAGRL